MYIIIKDSKVWAFKKLSIIIRLLLARSLTKHTHLLCFNESLKKIAYQCSIANLRSKYRGIDAKFWKQTQTHMATM